MVVGRIRFVGLVLKEAEVVDFAEGGELVDRGAIGEQAASQAMSVMTVNIFLILPTP